MCIRDSIRERADAFAAKHAEALTDRGYDAVEEAGARALPAAAAQVGQQRSQEHADGPLGGQGAAAESVVGIVRHRLIRRASQLLADDARRLVDVVVAPAGHAGAAH
eukprot:6214871-Prorocentrum_lima.AAC.1